MPSSGSMFHRMSSSSRGATASGGVTFMRVFSSLIPSTCFIACLLFAWTNFHSSLYTIKKDDAYHFAVMVGLTLAHKFLSAIQST